jgi:F-type H+-transporting ATPase subunit alpha
MLRELLDDTMDTVNDVVEHITTELHPRETGTILQVGGGIARINGLPDITSEELVQFPDGVLGVAINLDPDEVGVMMLGDSERLTAGIDVRSTGREADTPVGEGLLGRTIDATGRVLDGGKPLQFTGHSTPGNGHQGYRCIDTHRSWTA